MPIVGLRKICPTWIAYKEGFRNAEVQQEVREADEALLETILMASKGLINDQRRSTTDPKMGSIAQLSQALKIGHFPMWEMYAWRQRPLQEALVVVIRGAILINSLDPAQVEADAEQALRELVHPQNYVLRLIRDSLDLDAEIQVNWTLAQGQQLQPNLPLSTLSYPSRFICNFAMQLLWEWECVERDIVCVGLKKVLRRSGSSLKIVAPNAAEIWQEEAADLVLDRLERNLTEDCAPLIKAWGEPCGESSRLRAEVILRSALLSRDADIGHVASHANEKPNLDGTLSTTIRDCYRWWLHKCPQDPIPGKAEILPADSSLNCHDRIHPSAPDTLAAFCGRWMLMTGGCRLHVSGRSLQDGQKRIRSKPGSGHY